MFKKLLQRDNYSETLFALNSTIQFCTKNCIKYKMREYILLPIFNLKFYHFMPSSVINCHCFFLFRLIAQQKKAIYLHIFFLPVRVFKQYRLPIFMHFCCASLRRSLYFPFVLLSLLFF